MTAALYVSIARTERLVGNIERLTARMKATSTRRAMMLANAARHKERLDALMALLPTGERNRRETIRRFAAATYMTKRVSDGVEIYDRRARRIAVIPATDEGALHAALADAGRIQEGRWPGYTGGATREPGLALWWRDEQD